MFNFLRLLVFKSGYPRRLLVACWLTLDPQFHSSAIFQFDHLPGSILNPFCILVKFIFKGKKMQYKKLRFLLKKTSRGGPVRTF